MRTASIVCTVLLSGAALGAFAQERIKAKTPTDFESLHAAVLEHWKAERFGKCVAATRQLMNVVSMRRAKAIRAALPVPAGLAAEAVNDEDAAAASAMATAFAPGMGSVVSMSYHGEGKSVSMTVTADSPMLQMYRMVLQNPAMLQPNQEIVKYAECQAVLETEGRQVVLRFLLEDTMVEADFQGYDADGALGVFSQTAVTKLHGAIVN